VPGPAHRCERDVRLRVAAPPRDAGVPQEKAPGGRDHGGRPGIRLVTRQAIRNWTMGKMARDGEKDTMVVAEKCSAGSGGGVGVSGPSRHPPRCRRRARQHPRSRQAQGWVAARLRVPARAPRRQGEKWDDRKHMRQRVKPTVAMVTSSNSAGGVGRRRTRRTLSSSAISRMRLTRWPMRSRVTPRLSSRSARKRRLKISWWACTARDSRAIWVRLRWALCSCKGW